MYYHVLPRNPVFFARDIAARTAEALKKPLASKTAPLNNPPAKALDNKKQ